MKFARRFCMAFLCAAGLLLGSSAAQAQQTKVLPNDAELIVTINIGQILKSEVLKANKNILDIAKGKLNEQLEAKGIDKYLKKAGFDVLRDLGSMTFAVPGGNRPPQEGFILLEGNFDVDKIEAAATDASNDAGGGLKVTRIAGVKAFEITPQEEKAIFVGVLNKKTMIVAANKADFQGAVERFNGTKQSTLKAEVKSMLETVNAKQSISVVATSSVLAKMAENAPQGGGGDQAKQAAEVLKKVDGLSLAVTIQKNIDFQIGVNAKDNKTATEFAQLGNLLIGTAKSKVAEMAKQNEKVVPAVEVVNSLRASAQGSNLVVRGQVSFETLEKILQALPIPGN